MVTAGVYVIGRMNFLLVLSPTSMIVISTIGALTAFFAGTIALTQNDIKKVLAYSTISQLGYMFVAVGLGAVSVAVFHLVTHAFFKACLFLGSGSVIHAMHHEQDMRKMGGLRKKMPVTCATMAISAVAMAGIPPLSGFFSKDEILWKAFTNDLGHGWFLWLLGMAAAFCTALYMGRLILMTFAGSCRADEHTKAQIHESPRSMTAVLSILAVGAALVGFLGIPHFLGGHNHFGHFVDKAVALTGTQEVHGALAVEASLAVMSVMVALGGLFIAWRCYVRNPSLPAQYAEKHKDLYSLVNDKYRVDEFYAESVTKPLVRFAERAFFQVLDRKVIDDTINGVARIFRWLGARFASAQNGVARTYIAVMMVGLLLIILSLFT